MPVDVLLSAVGVNDCRHRRYFDLHSVLGDNLFSDMAFSNVERRHSTGSWRKLIWLYVKDSQCFGVVEFNDEGKVIFIEERSAKLKSHFEVTDRYFYDNQVLNVEKTIQPCSQGELEISSMNQLYWHRSSCGLKH